VNFVRWKLFFRIAFIGLLGGSGAALSVGIINFLFKSNGPNGVLQEEIAFFTFFAGFTIYGAIVAITIDR
jgi:hypothetical protein